MYQLTEILADWIYNKRERIVFFKHLTLFLIGVVVYSIIEIVWRGHTHWTMGILGGICFISIGLINELFEWKTPLLLQILIGSVIITVLEFFTGCVVNLWLGWNVWDYSNLPYNLLGQVCLQYSFYWIPISLMAIVLDDVIRYLLFDEELRKYKFI